MATAKNGGVSSSPEDQPGRFAAPQVWPSARWQRAAGEVAGLAGQAARAQGLAAGGVFGSRKVSTGWPVIASAGAAEQAGQRVVHLEPAVVGGDAPDAGRCAGEEGAEEGFVFLQLVAGLTSAVMLRVVPQ